MASKIYDSYQIKLPDILKQITNVEWVTKVLDKAMDGHTHDGTNSPLIDTSVTLDFDAGGGVIYVKTPKLT